MTSGTSISIHALREEGDIVAPTSVCAVWPFLSTPSVRRATAPGQAQKWDRDISIHALREEGDADKVSSDVAEIIFLSTPSARRATYLVAMEGETDSKFLSTPSARRATRH